MVGDQTGMQGAMEGKGKEDEGHRMLRKREQLLLCVHCARGPPTRVPCGELAPTRSETKDGPRRPALTSGDSPADF